MPIGKLLSSSRYATLSTVDQSGDPWAAPVWFVHDDQNIYWWSPTDTVHSKNISLNGKVYITIFNSGASEGDGSGLYIRASADLVEDWDVDKIIDLYNTSTEIFKLDRKNCTGNAPTRLYKATPQKIWVNKGEEIDGFYSDFRETITPV
jgi:general stress protein 26